MSAAKKAVVRTANDCARAIIGAVEQETGAKISLRLCINTAHCVQAAIEAHAPYLVGAARATRRDGAKE